MIKRAAIYMAGASALLFSGCTDQRDLYSISSSAVQIESDWVPSLNRHDMQEATAMLYKEDGDIAKEYFSQPNGVKARVSHGWYDILIFNGVMESESVTNLDHIYFMGTARPETFEARAHEGASAQRLARAADEYIASNNMELLAYAHESVFIEGYNEYYIKYKNGKNGYPVVPDFIEVVATMTPRAVSYRFQVKLTNLVNPTSARAVSGALRGFTGSVFPVSERRIPATGFSATHHLNLTPSANGYTHTTPEGMVIGGAQSPLFVSFGPPLPESLDGLESSGRFEFEMNFLLTDNTEFVPLNGPIDITPQVNEAVRKIFRYHRGEEDMAYDENLFTIEIAEEIFLPVIEPENVVDVVDWDDDEEIMIWIRN